MGLAVLRVIQRERLRENAATVGAALKQQLTALGEEHELIAGVNGRGLYLGVDLARDRDTLEPASEEAYAICERLRRFGVILQPTGEHSNVLKIKPPLCFSRPTPTTSSPPWIACCANAPPRCKGVCAIRRRSVSLRAADR